MFAKGELLLDHRLRRLRGGYRVSVQMHHLPDTGFGSKDHSGPQSDWGNVLAFANLGSFPHQRHYVSELGSHVLRYDLGANELTVPQTRRGTLESLGDLLPPAHGREEGVGEGYVFPVGEHRLIGFGVAFYELGSGELIVLDQFVNIVYGGHLLGITSRVGTYSLTSPHCDHPTLFAEVRGRGQPVEKLPRALFLPLFRGLNPRFCSVLAWVLGCFGLPTGPTTTFSTGWGFLGSPHPRSSDLSVGFWDRCRMLRATVSSDEGLTWRKCGTTFGRTMTSPRGWPSPPCALRGRILAARTALRAQRRGAASVARFARVLSAQSLTSSSPL